MQHYLSKKKEVNLGFITTNTPQTSKKNVGFEQLETPKNLD